MQQPFKALGVFCATLTFVLSAFWPAQAAYRTTLQPSISVTEEYTDNVNLLPEEFEESEWITVVSPSLALQVQGKTQGLNLSYTPGFTYYAENNEDSTIRHSASLDAWKQLTKHLDLNINNSYSKTEQPYSADTLALSTEEEERFRERYADYTRRQDREPHSSLTSHVSLGYQFGQKDSADLGYRYRRHWEETQDSEDSTEHSPYLNVSYWIAPHWGTEYSLEYTRGEFSGDTDTFDEWTGSVSLIRNLNRFWDAHVSYTHTIMDYHGETEDYQIYDPAAGLSWRFAPDGSVSLSLGYYIQDNEETENDSDLSFSGDINKGFDLSQRTSFRISGGSGYEQTYFGAENLGFTIYYQAQGRLTHALTRHLQSDVSVNFRRNEYQDEDPERDDNLWTFQSGLDWQFMERASLSLNYTYRISESSQDENDYDENKVMLSLTYSPKPYMFK